MSYIDVNYLKRLCNEIEYYMSFVVKVCEKSFESLSEVERFSIRYCIIVIAESLSIILMYLARYLLRRFRKTEAIETPIHAGKILRDFKILSQEDVDEIRRFIALRNIVVHRYWEIDDYKIYMNVKKNFRKLKELLNKVLTYVEKESIQN